MKYIRIELILLMATTSLLLGCKKDNPVSSAETLGTNPNNQSEFILQGGPYNNLSINADSGVFGKNTAAEFHSGSQGDLEIQDIGSFNIDGDTLIVALFSYAPLNENGTFAWEDRTHGNSNSYGLEIKFLSSTGKSTIETFRSLSGATRITRSGSGGNFIYKGEFAGTLADSLGTTYTVSNGKF
jgi:hypothetical protein